MSGIRAAALAALSLSLLAGPATAVECLAATPHSAAQPGSAWGIDVSHYQGKVRWDHVAGDGVAFAFAKATGGETFVDPEFHANWHGMREAEIVRGAYHFYLASDDATAQAEHFAKTVGKLIAHDLPPVIDVEIVDHANKAAIIEGTLTWLRVVEQRLGRKPIIYTDPAFGTEFMSDERFRSYVLWVADYRAGAAPSVPRTWQGEKWTLWQHSQCGKVIGVPGHVDLNVFNGSTADLEAFVARY